MSVLVEDDVLARFALAPGFQCAATACGLKKSGALDLALVWSERHCAAAGLFTTNRVKAAPVVLDRQTLPGSAARIRAVVANAGCANAVTGERGLADARRMASLAAEAVEARPDEVLVLSTGVIGVHLDMDKLGYGIAALRAPGRCAPRPTPRVRSSRPTPGPRSRPPPRRSPGRRSGFRASPRAPA